MKNLLKNEKFKKLLNVKVLAGVAIVIIAVLSMLFTNTTSENITTENMQTTENITIKNKNTNTDTNYARPNIVASCSIRYNDVIPNKNILDAKYENIKDANELKTIVINLRKNFEKHEGNYLSSIMLRQPENTQKALYEKLYNEYVPYKTELLKIHTLAKKRLEISVEQLKNAFNDLKTSNEELDAAFRAEEMYTDLVNTTKRYIEIVECSE